MKTANVNVCKICKRDNIKLIACDIDGTLIDDNKNISLNMLRIIEILKHRNIHFILTTGRNDIYVKGLAEKAKIIDPIIGCNGASIRNVFTGEIIYKKFFAEKIVEKIIKYCLERKYDFTLSAYDMMYCVSYSNRVEIFLEYNRQMKEEYKVPIKFIKSKEDVNCKEILKIFLWKLSEEEVKNLKETFKFDDLTIVSSEKSGIDITCNNVNKGYAVSVLADYYKLNMNQIAIFGDNYNDISMLKLTENSFAMANAEDIVKENAKYTIQSNNDDGVAKAIEKYIL